MASLERRLHSLEDTSESLKEIMLNGFSKIQRSIDAGGGGGGGGGGAAAVRSTSRNPRASRNSVSSVVDDGPGSKEVYAALMDFVDGGDGDVPSQSDVDPVWWIARSPNYHRRSHILSYVPSPPHPIPPHPIISHQR